MRPLVIYHGGCNDGFGAAYAAWRKFGDDAEYLPGAYQEEPPDVTGRVVYLLDFSYKRSVIEGMLEVAEAIVVVDHHKSAMEELGHLSLPNFNPHIDLNNSGAVLAWNYFHPGKEVPELLRYIEDRDLWRFGLSYSREVNAALSSYDHGFGTWDELMSSRCNYIDVLTSDGRVILRHQSKDIKEIVGVATRRVVIAERNVPCVNIPHLYGSDACHLLVKGEPFAAYYWDSPKYREFGLRSDESGIDVSQVAQLLGGGGHARAAGFKVTRERAWEFEIK